jgi:hypothetical protein
MGPLLLPALMRCLRGSLALRPHTGKEKVLEDAQTEALEETLREDLGLMVLGRFLGEESPTSDLIGVLGDGLVPWL